MATPRPPEPPPVMALIRERRSARHLSYARAAALMAAPPISDTRWRQLESGARAISGVGYIPEPAPAATLARMALVVGVTAAELEQLGRADAAGELRPLAAELGAREEQARAEAARLSASVDGLTPRQRAALEERITADLMQILGPDGK